MAYVLIVDDDEDFAIAAATVLRDVDHEVEVELDHQKALARIDRRRPDLVILDVMFPDSASAGFDLARTIRHYHEELRQMPILMLTAVNVQFPLGFGSQDIDDTWLPVTDFLEKPVDFDVLRSKVSTLLREGKQASTDATEET